MNKKIAATLLIALPGGLVVLAIWGAFGLLIKRLEKGRIRKEV